MKTYKKNKEGIGRIIQYVCPVLNIKPHVSEFTNFAELMEVDFVKKYRLGKDGSIKNGFQTYFMLQNFSKKDGCENILLAKYEGDKYLVVGFLNNSLINNEIHKWKLFLLKNAL